MAKSPEQQIALMVDAAQPHCDEPIESAIICGHAGSMSQLLASKFLGAGGGSRRTSELPNLVLLAIGPATIFAFKYTPKGFKIKLKKGAEVARWPRASVEVQTGAIGMVVSDFSMITSEGAVYDLEVTTALGGSAAFEHFINALQAPQP